MEQILFFMQQIQPPESGSLDRWVIYILLGVIAFVIPALAKILHNLYQDRLKEMRELYDKEHDERLNLQNEMNRITVEFMRLLDKMELRSDGKNG